MSKKRVTARQKRIIAGVVERWAATISGASKPDLKMAEKCIRAAYPDGGGDAIKVVFVRSPQMFYILQGVCRGMISKAMARELVKKYELTDEHLIDEVKRDPMTRLKRSSRWTYMTSGLPLETAWSGIFSANIDEERIKRADVFNILTENELLAAGNSEESESEESEDRQAARNRRWLAHQDHAAIMIIRHEEARSGVLSLFDPVTPSNRHSAEAVAISRARYTSGAADAMRSRLPALSATLNNTMSQLHNYTGDMIDREIFCKLAGVNDLAVTWEHEIFHHAEAFMLFKNQALILSSQPIVVTNTEYELDCDTGPAVEWPDGSKIWVKNGHRLGRIGKKIVMSPEDLTAEDFTNEANQEIRRIILDIMGWDKYLNGAGAYVLDKRENDVDNTVELLIVVPETPDKAPKTREEALTITDRRMVLACRSTGRKYCLGVNDTATTCEEAQNWLSEGFLMPKSNKIKVPSLPMRVIGAS